MGATPLNAVAAHFYTYQCHVLPLVPIFAASYPVTCESSLDLGEFMNLDLDL